MSGPPQKKNVWGGESSNQGLCVDRIATDNRKRKRKEQSKAKDEVIQVCLKVLSSFLKRELHIHFLQTGWVFFDVICFVQNWIKWIEKK